MSGNGTLPPAVVAAIEAVESAPPQVAVRQFNVTLSSTGRPAAVVLPVDASDFEIAELCGWVLTAVLGTHRAEREAAASPIIVPPKPALVRA